MHAQEPNWFTTAPVGAVQKLLAKTGWKVSDAPADYIQNLSRAIVGVEVRITSMEGKRKLSQNRPVWDQKGVIAGLEGLDSSAAAAVARDMRALER